MTTKQTGYEITIKTSPTVLVPSLITYLQHMYNSDKDAAVLELHKLFMSKLKPIALVKILTEEYLPIYSIDDLVHDSITYYIPTEEVHEDKLD